MSVTVFKCIHVALTSSLALTFLASHMLLDVSIQPFPTCGEHTFHKHRHQGGSRPLFLLSDQNMASPQLRRQ